MRAWHIDSYLMYSINYLIYKEPYANKYKTSHSLRSILSNFLLGYVVFLMKNVVVLHRGYCHFPCESTTISSEHSPIRLLDQSPRVCLSLISLYMCIQYTILNSALAWVPARVSGPDPGPTTHICVYI